MSVTQATKSLKSRARAHLYDALGITTSLYRGAVMPAPIASKKGTAWSGPGAISICLHCKTEIRHKPSHRRKYCSKECRVEGERLLSRALNTRPCLVCQEPIYRPPAHHLRTLAGLYCSHKCHGIGNRGENNPAYTGGRVALSCRKCGKVYTRKRSGASEGCCSKRCASILRWDLGVGSLQRLCEKPCLQCRGMFLPSTRTNKFCSQNCKNEAHAARVLGAGNGRFVHGQATRAYPRGWNKNHKALVRKRDGFCCQVCGKPESTRKAHHVHHIDYDKDNLDITNLITVCAKCHGSMHGDLTKRQNWKKVLSSLLEA